jgi:hypothetical protein
MTDRGTRLVEDWKPAQITLNALRAELHFDPLKELPAFIDHFCSTPGARGLKLNWEMTFKNWCRKAAPKIKHAPAPRPQPINAAPTDTRDHLLFWANRLMLRHLISRGGLGTAQLEACRKVVQDTVKWFLNPVREGDEDATPAAFLTMIAQGFGKVSPLKESTRQAWGRMLKEPGMQKPFGIEMARVLNT